MRFRLPDGAQDVRPLAGTERDRIAAAQTFAAEVEGQDIETRREEARGKA